MFINLLGQDFLSIFVPLSPLAVWENHGTLLRIKKKKKKKKSFQINKTCEIVKKTNSIKM